MSQRPVRVRFAPAPTGMMHLGNVRQVVLNFLFAHQAHGTFVLRIEDTDQQRVFDPEGARIVSELKWLGLVPDEGPGFGGPYGPYFQSQRASIYERYRAKLEELGYLYRCFCSAEELEAKRERQIALKKAPRYDRTCMRLQPAEVNALLEQKKPFIWRFRIDPAQVVITDLVRGEIHFDMNNFSDAPITRQDGSVTFIFANCVDDIEMRITHVFRGEDHLSNSATQAMMYRALGAEIPFYWHTPIVCNREGKKLSKRDFGFALDDLRVGGYVPEAIVNYLATIGFKNAEQEIASVAELVKMVDLSHHGTANTIRYDSDKLRWMNHEWLKRLPAEVVAARSRPFLEAVYPKVQDCSEHELARIIKLVQSEMHTLADAVQLLHPYFHNPEIDTELLNRYGFAQHRAAIAAVVAELVDGRCAYADLLSRMKQVTAEHSIPAKSLWALLRIALTGIAEGSTMSVLLEFLPQPVVIARLQKLFL